MFYVNYTSIKTKSQGFNFSCSHRKREISSFQLQLRMESFSQSTPLRESKFMIPFFICNRSLKKVKCVQLYQLLCMKKKTLLYVQLPLRSRYRTFSGLLKAPCSFPLCVFPKYYLLVGLLKPSVSLAYSGTLHKCNSIAMCLASSIQHSICKIHPMFLSVPVVYFQLLLIARVGKLFLQGQGSF